MANLRVVIQDHTRSTKTTAELPDGVPMNRLLPVLAERMNLPLDQDGRQIVYQLDHRRLGRRLDEEDTLAAAGVRPDDTLTLLPEITAGARSDEDGAGEQGVDLEALRKSLASIPEVTDAEVPDVVDAFSVAEELTKVLRKLGVQQMRDTRSLVASLEEPVQRAVDLHDSLAREQQRARDAERQIVGITKSLLLALDLLDRMQTSFARLEGMEVWSQQVVEGIATCLREAEKSGLVALGRAGEAFDEAIHDIQGTIPPGASSLRVGRTVGRGYALNGKVLRRAEITVEDA